MRIHGSGSVDTYSAGSNPSGVVSPKAVAAMREAGYDLTLHRSKPLDEVIDMEYDIVVTMGCGDACPFVRAGKRVDWSIPDPKGMDLNGVRAVRDMIEDRVKLLLSRLQSA